MTAPTTARARQLWRGPADVPTDLGSRVVTLGVFDGVHLGHARLIDRALETGRALGLPTVLVTFDSHPARVVGLLRDTAALSTVERRAELVWDHGVDEVCVLPFTKAFARLEPAEFVAEVLVSRLHAAAVVVGDNFTFGHRGAGTVETLRRLGERHGFRAHGVDLLRAASDDMPLSSTYIRDCLRRGDLDGARRVLGRPHRVEGFLSADGELVVAEHTALPAPGQYAGRLTTGLPVDVRVTEEGHLALHPSRPQPGPAGLDLLAAR